MTTPQWASFGANIKTNETTLDVKVGGLYLGEGRHSEVKVTGISPIGSEGQGCRVDLEKDGMTHTGTIWFLNYNKDDLSNQFKDFLAAAVPTLAKRAEVIDQIKANPALLNRFVGNVQADVILGYKKIKSAGRAYKIDELATGGFVIKDVFDDSEPEETAGEVYDSIQEARDARKEFGLYGQYLEILKILKVEDSEKLAENESKLMDALAPQQQKTASNGF